MPYYTHNYTYYDSPYNHLYKNSNHLILYTHTDIHHDSIFVLNYIYFHLIYISTHTIHAEFKIYPDIKLNTFRFKFFILFGTCTIVFGSSIVLQLPPYLLALRVNG